MAFINDYLTEEEKAKFEEYSIMYPQGSGKRGLKVGADGNRGRCTVDREKKMYLFHTINSYERREFIRNVDYFTLVIVKEDGVSVAYFELEDISTSIDYHVYWKMCGINKNLVKGISDDELNEYLKDALTAYGISGKLGKSTARIGFAF